MDSPVASLPLISPQPGFICGTVPVPTATDRHSLELVTVQASSMKVVSDSSGSLRYSFLPTEMDLNALPPNWLKREELNRLNPQLLTNEDTQVRDADDLCDSCSHHSLSRPLPKKCEHLVVHGLAAYGDAIDFIAPASVMKQIFKTPYSKAPISVAVHRIGKTLVLNDGPDAAESTSKQSSQSMTVNRDLFYKFVHHSVNATPAPSDSNSDEDHARTLPQDNPCRAWQFYTGGQSPGSKTTEAFVDTERESSPGGAQCSSPGNYTDTGPEEPSASWARTKRTGAHRKAPPGKATETGLGELPASWPGTKRTGISSRHRGKQQRALGHTRAVGPTSASKLELGASDKGRASGVTMEDEPLSSEGEEGPEGKRNRERFLRVLFWQFRDLQMLLGSDLLLFGNDQHKAVALYLMELDRPSSPLPWLDAWLDCLMAAVPEVAVCYHKKGVVQGYELLKTDDLCLLKGVAPDGTIAFHPQVVHANAAAVLRFLQRNCTSEPGAYWLVKNAGEDVMQLFDLSTIADAPNEAEGTEDDARPLRSPEPPHASHRYEQALAVLIYRLALQLAHSNSSGDQRRSGQLLLQCLALMEEKNGPDLVAAAHERMARLCSEASIRPLLLGPHSLLEPPPSKQLLCAQEGASAEESRNAREWGNEDRANAENPSESITAAPAEGSGTRTVQMEAQVLFRVGSTGQAQKVTQEVTGGSEGAPRVTDFGEEPAAPDRSSLDASPAVFGDEASWKADQTVGQSGSTTPQGSAVSSSEHSSKAAIQQHLSAAHHFSEAIKALREELTMLTSKTAKRKPSKPGESERGLGKVGAGEQFCSCKGVRHEARVARTLSKMRGLMGSLAASYLNLGRAYEGDGQLARALKAAELAALVGGCLTEQEGGGGKEGRRPSVTQALPSLSPTKQKQLPGEDACPYKSGEGKSGEGESGEGSESVGASSALASGLGLGLGSASALDSGSGSVSGSGSGSGSASASASASGLVSPSGSKLGSGLGLDGGQWQPRHGHVDQSVEPTQAKAQRKGRRGATRESKQTAPVPSPDFWGRLWLFVGDVYVQLQKQWTEETLLAQQAALLSGAPRLHEAVAEEVERRTGGRGAGDGRPATVNGSSSSNSGRAVGSSETRERGRREASKKGARATAVAASDADLLCFGRPLSLDYDVNLSAAAKRYGQAIAVLETDAPSGTELGAAHRRLGWTANELGRRRLEEGDLSGAEALFLRALNSFVAVKDCGNAVLVHCNMGHARRGQAEAMVADTTGSDRYNKIRMAHTCRCYRQALSHFIDARSELLSLGEAEAQRSLRGLWNEAHTQLAHTYLRFGMFLAARGQEQSSDVTTLAVAGSNRKSVPTHAPEPDSGPSVLLTKALHLYESLGPAREQEAAYSHFQLAAFFRDRCLYLRPPREMSPPPSPAIGQRSEDGRWKRCAALAELHWQNSLEVYRTDSHPDMVIRIGIERSALGLKCAPKSRPNMVVEAALSGLEGIPQLLQPSKSPRDCTDGRNSNGYQEPSKATVGELRRHLESAVKELLQVHVSFLKHRTTLDDAITAAAQETVSRFKIMYKQLLQIGSATDRENEEVGVVLRSMLDARPSQKRD